MISANFLLVMAMVTGPAGDTVHFRDVQAGYSEVFHLVTHVTGPDTAAGVLVVRHVPEANRLAGFERDNGYVLTYLVQHGPLFDYRDVIGHGSVEDRTERLHAALRSDPRFNAVLGEVLVPYFASRGDVLIGAPPRSDTVPTIQFEDVRHVAVRFFYPDKIESDGRVTGHICVGINGLRDYERGRNLMVEAFVYAAIFRELDTPHYDVREDFQKALDLINSIGLSQDPSAKLSRAQGLAWGFMSGSLGLEQLLRDAYETRSASLPFRVAG